MAFTEGTKLEAKRKAHFCCVICHQPFVEVHHIVPQAKGGSDDLDNAAPLCGSCHDLFGANPEKQKQIQEMRDFWWELCENRESQPNVVELFEKVDGLQTDFLSAREDQKKQQEILEEVRGLLLSFHDQSRNQIVEAQSFTEVVTVSGVSSPFYPNPGT